MEWCLVVGEGEGRLGGRDKTLVAFGDSEWLACRRGKVGGHWDCPVDVLRRYVAIFWGDVSKFRGRRTSSGAVLERRRHDVCLNEDHWAERVM